MFNGIIPLLGFIALMVVVGLVLIRPVRRSVITRPIFSRAVSWQAGLAEAAWLSAANADAGRAVISRHRVRGSLPTGQ